MRTRLALLLALAASAALPAAAGAADVPANASVTLPFLKYTRPSTIQGDPGTQLAGYNAETITVPPETLRDSVSNTFKLPPQQTPAP